MSTNTSDNQNPHHLSFSVVAILRTRLILVFLACLLTGCATTTKPFSIPPVQEKRPADTQPLPSIEQRIEESLKNFEIIIRTENAGIGPGPDGKNVPYLGRDAALQMILKFQNAIHKSISPDLLVARIGHLPFPFTEQISDREFITKETYLTSIPSGLNIGPTGVSLFYNGRELESSFSKGTVAIDTTPPPKPVGLRVLERSGTHFTLTWELDRMSSNDEVKEYLVKKLVSSKWITIDKGFTSPPVRINSRHSGHFRIIARDYALNETMSEEINFRSMDVTLSVIPISARVWFDGTSIELNDSGAAVIPDVLSGTHTFRIEGGDGYQPVIRNVPLTPQSNRHLTFELPKRYIGEGKAVISYQCRDSEKPNCPPHPVLEMRAIAVAKTLALALADICSQAGVSLQAVSTLSGGRMDKESVVTKSGGYISRTGELSRHIGNDVVVIRRYADEVRKLAQ